jgi:hypothetical protein
MLINAYRLNHDKKVWSDPETFRPERFLDENMAIVKDSNNKLLSFGAGRWRSYALLLACASPMQVATKVVRPVGFPRCDTNNNKYLLWN